MSTRYDSLKDTELIQGLINGEVGVMPTDTLYGVVCCASHERAVKRLYALKSREAKPGTLIAASMQQLIELGFTSRYIEAYENFWPNPLSIVVPSSLPQLDLGLGTMAVRVVKGPPELIDLLQQTGPLLTSSANMPGEPPANTIDEAQLYFDDTVDFYVDGGDLTGHLPSTVVRVVDDAIEVLRTGAVSISESGRIS